MIWLCLLIPLAAVLIQYKYFSQEIHPWEYVLQFLIPTLLIFCTKLGIETYLTTDLEYLSGYALTATHEEPWNEYIHQTCTRTVSDGNGGTTTQTYDCSYVKYHPERWDVLDNMGNTLPIPQQRYRHLTSIWGNNKKVGRNRGYTISGDIFKTKWGGQDKNLQKVVVPHKYTNKVQSSSSVFNFSQENPEGLFDYPEAGFETPSVLGYKNCRCFDLLNSKLGKPYQIRVWILVYNNKPMSIFERQRNFWKNGNKNEFIYGIGLKNGRVSWVNTMTWCEVDEFNVEARNLVKIGQPLNLCELEAEFRPLVQKKWKRKSFEDFQYLSVDLPPSATIMILLLTLTSSVGLAIFFIKNDLKEN